MCGNMSPFRYFFADIRPIIMKDPLAEFLGAYEHHNAYLEYTFDEVVKMTGHVCPTVASAFVCCKKALGHLHMGEIPNRGNISVTIHSAPNERNAGVIGQIFGFVTGACGDDGFKGLDGKFRRNGLLSYAPNGAGGAADGFTFARLDNGKKVHASILSANFPTIPGQEEIPALMDKALKGLATHDEGHKFQDLWMEKVKAIVLEERNVEAWLVINPA